MMSDCINEEDDYFSVTENEKRENLIQWSKKSRVIILALSSNSVHEVEAMVLKHNLAIMDCINEYQDDLSFRESMEASLLDVNKVVSFGKVWPVLSQEIKWYEGKREEILKKVNEETPNIKAKFNNKIWSFLKDWGNDLETDLRKKITDLLITE